MPRLNDLHNRICRDCDRLGYYDGYYCDCEEMEQELWDKILYQGVYIPVKEELKECKYFSPRTTCIPSDEVKECQFWCLADHHGNPEECPLWELRPENN